MKRRALGRGLSSLLPQAAPEKPAISSVPFPAPGLPDTQLEIDVDRIRPNRMQPRSEFDEEAILVLAKSLKNNGVIQPVVVRPLDGGRYELIAGERRWRAAQRAGLLRIPAMVRAIPDEQLLEYALVENLQRQDLNPMDEARAYRTLIEDLGLTQQEVAEKVGKQRATVANILRLLSLTEAVQNRVRSGELSMGHARALAAVTDESRQADLAAMVVREGLSVRQLEILVSRVVKRAPSGKPSAKDPNVLAAEKALQTALGTKVVIAKSGKGGGGRIEIHFYSEEELESLYMLLQQAGKTRP